MGAFHPGDLVSFAGYRRLAGVLYKEVETVESIYAFIIVLSLATLTFLAALVVRELKNLNAILGDVLSSLMKNRMEDLGLKKRTG